MLKMTNSKFLVSHISKSRNRQVCLDSSHWHWYIPSKPCSRFQIAHKCESLDSHKCASESRRLSEKQRKFKITNVKWNEWSQMHRRQRWPRKEGQRKVHRESDSSSFDCDSVTDSQTKRRNHFSSLSGELAIGFRRRKNKKNGNERANGLWRHNGCVRARAIRGCRERKVEWANEHLHLCMHKIRNVHSFGWNMCSRRWKCAAARKEELNQRKIKTRHRFVLLILSFSLSSFVDNFFVVCFFFVLHCTNV